MPALPPTAIFFNYYYYVKGHPVDSRAQSERYDTFYNLWLPFLPLVLILIKQREMSGRKGERGREKEGARQR